MALFGKLHPRRFGKFINEIKTCVEITKLLDPEKITYVELVRMVRDYKFNNDGNGEDYKRRENQTVYGAEAKKKMMVPEKRCFICDQIGHFKRDCPILKEVMMKKLNGLKNSDGEDAKDSNILLKNYLLDTGATKSIANPDDLNDIQRTDSTYSIKGIGGQTFTINQDGYLPDFHRVLASDKVHANVLSFAELEDAGGLFTYIPKAGFIYEKEGKKHWFKRDGNVFKLKGGERISEVLALENDKTREKIQHNSAYIATVEEMKKFFNARDNKKIEEAKEFIEKAGFPSLEEAIRLVEAGAITDLDLTAKDLKNYDKVYGKQAEYWKGRMVAKKIRSKCQDASKMSNDPQDFYTDIMFIGSQSYLFSVADPLGLLLVLEIESHSSLMVGRALQQQVDAMEERGYQVKNVFTDGEGAFKVARGRIPGTRVEIGGAGDHNPKADIWIRIIKQRFGSVRSNLPWKLPKFLIADPLYFVVQRVNMEIGRNNAESPWTQMTGYKPSAKKEYSSNGQGWN